MAARSMRAAVVGDSVVWGQGHAPTQKFYNLAFAALRAAGSLDITVPDGLFTAQSGAQASNIDARNEFVAGLTPPKKVVPRTGVSGEIPSARPSVRDQVAALRPRKAEFEVLVMDGGANDIDFLAAGMPLDGSQDEAVQQATRFLADRAARAGMSAKEYFFTRFFEDRLQAINLLLGDTRSLEADWTFYTGYYPGLSEDTSIDELAGLASGAGAAWLASALLGPLGLLAGLFAGVLARRELEQAARQVEYFYAKLTGELTRHIARHNERGATVHYVSPRFAAGNAMFAAQSWIYAPTDGGDAAVKAARTTMYEQRTGESAPFFVTHAHAAHPNAAGSRQYGRRLAEEVDRCVNFSLRREAERLAPGEGAASLLARLGLGAGGGSLRALVRLALIETVEFVYRFKHTVLVFDGDAEDHFLCLSVPLRTAAGDFSGRAFRTQKHIEVLFDLRGAEYAAVKYLTFEFEEYNFLRDPEGELAIYVNGYQVFQGNLTAKSWTAAARSGHRRYKHTLR